MRETSGTAGYEEDMHMIALASDHTGIEMKKEIMKMLDEQVAEGKARELEVNCRFCGRNYTFDEATLGGLFQ